MSLTFVPNSVSSLLLPKQCEDCLRKFDAQIYRKDFPILSTLMCGQPLAYLDNSATTQKPQIVIDRLMTYYQEENANVHRGVYTLSQKATDQHEAAREKVRAFINADSASQIIFTRGATESINLVASCFGRTFLKTGDEIIISAMEHHSNIVPWQLICQQTGAVLRVIPINDRGELLMEEYRKLLSPRTRLVAVTHLSNALGTINPVKELAILAHEHGARILIDGAQWVGHFATDVQEIDCDFYAFSGHKMFGPTGIGVLYGKTDILQQLPPYQGGGDMIEQVRFEKTTYADLPNKFEAGTPHIAGAVGLGAAIGYLSTVGFQNLVLYEHALMLYAEARLKQIPGVRIIGQAASKASVVSFILEDPPIASMDIGLALDRAGVAVRTGHHCCMPLMDRLGIASTTRASLSFYNTPQEVDRLADTVDELLRQTKRTTAKAPAIVKPIPANVIWPQPVADSPAAAAAELIEAFDLLGDWEQRDQFVLDLGSKLPPMPDAFKTEQTFVHGCMSTVHMVGRKRTGATNAVDILADSDAHLVRGLIGLLQRVFSGQKATDILAFDFETLLRQLGLDRHLSMGRRNGLEGMLKRIRTLAAGVKQTGAVPKEFAV